MPVTLLHRGRARMLGVLALLIGAIGLAGVAAPAQAAVTIWPTASSLPGNFDGTGRFAVDQATGAIVHLRSGGGVTRIDENGMPMPFANPALNDPSVITSADVPSFFVQDATTTIAIDNSGGATQGHIFVMLDDVLTYTLWTFDADGVLLSTVTRPGRGCGIGFDGQGDMWIGSDDRFVEYTPAGVATGAERVVPQTVMPPPNFVCESVFDDAGNMFGRISGLATVVRFDADGNFVQAIANATMGLLIDPESQNVLTSRLVMGTDGQKDRLVEYDANGIEQWRSEPLITSGRLALGKDRKTLVMAVQNWMGSTFQVFGPSIRRPEVEAAGAVTTSSATLTGTVSPGGRPTSYQFEYGTTKALGSPSPATPVDAGSGTAPVAATIALTGLKPQTYYYYRLKATVGGVEVLGITGRFRTRGPAVAVSGVSDVATSSVTVSGTVDAVGLPDASYHFLVTDPVTGFARTSDEQAVPAGSGPQPVTGSVTGLPAGRTLTAQLVAGAGDVVAGSEPVRFSTPQRPVHPVVPGPAPDLAPYGCTVPVRVDCGRRPTSAKPPVAPSNAFTVTKTTIKSTVATLSVKLPGAGTLAVSGSGLVSAKVKAGGARAVSVKAALSKAGKRKLRAARSGVLRVTVRLRYTPTGGSSRTVTKTITFKRGGAR